MKINAVLRAGSEGSRFWKAIDKKRADLYENIQL